MKDPVVLPARPTCQICRRRAAVVEQEFKLGGSLAFMCAPCSQASGTGRVAPIHVDSRVPFVAF